MYIQERFKNWVSNNCTNKKLYSSPLKWICPHGNIQSHQNFTTANKMHSRKKNTQYPSQWREKVYVIANRTSIGFCQGRYSSN